MPNDELKVPPNAEWFFTCQNREGYVWVHHLTGSVCLNHALDGYNPPDEQQRKIIAAVAAQYWQRETDKLYAKCQKEGRVHDRYGIEDDPEFEVINEMFGHLNAWLKWGGLA